MKLKDRLIVTFVDLERYFDLKEFWAKRRSFVRDFAPERVAYYAKKEKGDLLNAYNLLKEFIINEDIDITEDILDALKLISGKNDIEIQDLQELMSTVEGDIITLRPGDTKRLPGKNMPEEEARKLSLENNKPERLHKIECIPDNNQDYDLKERAYVWIGSDCVEILGPDECVYVTEIDGKYLRALPRKFEDEYYSIKILNKSGEFCSDIIYRNMRSGNLYVKANKTNFWIDETGRPEFSDEGVIIHKS